MAGLMDTLRDQRRQQATDEIARAALHLFTNNGYEKTSVDEIATAAGCSPRTFYRYFGSKEDVMFHDIPVMSEALRTMLSMHLDRGAEPWIAIEETLTTLIGRFGQTDEDFATARMNLWLNEPGLLARFTHYMTEAENVVAECLHAHRRGGAKRDDVALVVAAMAIAAYRVTLQTQRAGSGRKLATHLKANLAHVRAGAGAALSTPSPPTRTRRTS